VAAVSNELMSRILLVCLVALSGVAQTSSDAFAKKLVAAADDRPNHVVRYDPGYVKIAYPNGEVPAKTGVCTDEIIRIYRAVGIDLQRLVHEDMGANRSAYQRASGRLDTNIDHRRVPNLAVFFGRKGQTLAITGKPADYLPGDIVIWMLPNGRDHIGMVTDRKAVEGRYMVEHNIGEGPKIEDVLMEWKITGHYRYRPASMAGSNGQ